MRKHFALLLALPLVAAGCSSSLQSAAPQKPVVPSPVSAPTVDEERAALLRVTPVVACNAASKARVDALFPGKDFKQIMDRQPEAQVVAYLSSCSWMTDTTDAAPIPTSVDLTARSFVNQKEADRFLESGYTMTKEGGTASVDLPEFGKNAFAVTRGTYGMQTLTIDILKGNVYYQLAISTNEKKDQALMDLAKGLLRQF